MVKTGYQDSENGGAEFVVDSDLKSQAGESMADEPNALLFPPEYEAEHTQGNKRRMVAKAKLLRLLRKI